MKNWKKKFQVFDFNTLITNLFVLFLFFYKGNSESD